VNGSQPNMGTYSLMTAIWEIWSELSREFTPHWLGAENRLFVDRLWTLTKHISATEHGINNRKETCQSTGTLLHTPKKMMLMNFGPETAENSWRVFAQPPKFPH